MPETKLMAYKTAVCPTLDDGIIWDPHSQKLVDELERIQQINNQVYLFVIPENAVSDRVTSKS